MGFSFSLKIWFVSSVLILLGAAVANAAPDLLKDKVLSPLPNLQVHFVCDANGALKPVKVVGSFPLFASRVPSNYVSNFAIADVQWKERPELALEGQDVALYVRNSRFQIARMNNDEYKKFLEAPACEPQTKQMMLLSGMGTDITYQYGVSRDCTGWRSVYRKFPQFPIKQRDCTIKNKISYRTESGVTELIRTEEVTESDDLINLPDLN